MALIAGSPAAAQDLEPLLQRAHALVLAGKPAEAIALFEQADEASGGRSAEASIGAAVAHLRLDHHAEAIEYAKHALAMELPPAQAIDALAVLGSAIYERERREWLNRLGGYLVAAYASRQRGEPAPPRPSWDETDLVEAETAFRRVLELSGGKANQARVSLAEVLRRERRFDDGIELLEEFKRNQPEAGAKMDIEPLESCLRWSATGNAPREFDGDYGESVKPPVKVSSVSPQYTYEAREAAIEGVVMMRSIITEKGNVECIDVVRELPLGLTAEAVRVARLWKFKPATVDGEPVPISFQLTVNFRLLAP